MDKITFVGCDVHDKTLVLKIARGRGEPADSVVENSPAGRKKLLKELGRLRKAGQRVLFAYEASGHAWVLYDEVSAAGIECCVIPPTQVKRTEKQKRNKNDERDAEQLLAMLRNHVLAGDKLPQCWVPDRQTRDDRELMRMRQDVAEKAAQVKVQIKALLKRHGIRRPENVKGKAYWEWLRSAEGPQAGLGEGGRFALQSLLRQVSYLTLELRRAEREVVKLGRSERHVKRVEALTQIKGVGLLSALTFLVEMGELKRFKNRRQIGAYVGLVPSSYDSGESARPGRITRQGPARLRKMLCQCAWAVARTDPVEKALAERIRERNPKKRKKALVALMRRLAIRMWHVGSGAA